jgi:protoporphyrinogen/coproporphyrinogen III oxidase
VLEYVTEPLLAGVYGGEAAQLSARSVLPRFVDWEEQYGSLIRGARAQPRTSGDGSLFRSFRDGMQSLTDTLADRIQTTSSVQHADVRTVEQTAAGWRVRTGDASVEAGHVVLACPAYAAAGLLQAGAPQLSADLGAIPYSSAILATLLYRKQDVHHPLDGFGFLVPPAERNPLAAATWINTKFPARVADGVVALRGFIVGEGAVRLEKSSEVEVAEQVAHDFGRLMGITAKPFTSVVVRWPKSMPQYVVGHAKRIEAIARECGSRPGLHLVGNAYEGVGIPDCVRLAKTTAEAIAAAHQIRAKDSE